MKNVFETLKDFGIDVPEEKQGDILKSINDNYKTIAEFQKIKEQNTALNGQLTAANESLKKFDGIKPEEYQTEIQNLKNQMAAESQKAKEQLADLEFDHRLSDGISKSGALNPKTVRALLDVDKLKASQNFDKDLDDSIKAIKESDGYLFPSEEPYKNPIGFSGNNQTKDASSYRATLRSVMGLPPEKK